MRALLVVVIAVAGPLACASAAPHQSMRPSQAFPGQGERLPAPGTTADAQIYLSGAVAAMRANQPQQATVFIDAILRSDHLTERGRANVYWLAAEAHRLAGNEAALVDALGGFLVSAAVLEPHAAQAGTGPDPDDDMRLREIEARAAIVARKVKIDSALGKSPSDAIPVEDDREPSGIVAELACGVRGDSRYVEDEINGHGEDLEERRLICKGTGEPLVLWFDMTHSQVH